MLLRTIADKQGELVFSDHFPVAVQPLLIPGAVCYGTSGPFGHLLYQALHTPHFSLWHRVYYLQRFASFTCIHAQPALKMVFQLNGSLNYYSAALGPQEFHEHAYNLCFVPSVHNKMMFRKEGLYSHLEIHITETQLQHLMDGFPVLNSFVQCIHQQQPALLMRVHQVATYAMMHTIRELLFHMNNNDEQHLVLQNKCEELLITCLRNMTEHPRTRAIRIPPKEIDALYYARDLLQQHIHLPGLPEHLAAQVQLSDYKLKNGFQQLYNTSPAEYLHHLRMEKAMTMLYEEHQNMYDVAEQTGYTNVNSFITAFKRYYHVSPVIYGKQVK
jgi:AraC-like DNA-binding protein